MSAWIPILIPIPRRAVGAAWAAAWRILLLLALSVVSGAAIAWLLAPFRTPGFAGLLLGTVATVLGLLFGSWVMVRYVERRPFAALGLHARREVLRELGWGTALGIALMGAASVLLLLAGGFSVQAAAGTAADWLGKALVLAAFILVAAAAEELLFRGYAFQVLVQRVGVVSGVVLSAGLFSVAHLWNPGIRPLGLLNLALAGALLALAYLKTRSLWFVIGVHGGWNWVLAAPLDQPVSGLFFDMPGYDVREVGPDVWTGGAFGPEGGLVATAITVAGAFWLARTRRIQPSEAARAVRPLIDQG